ncbi:MAG: hypothetical protein ACR2MB_05200 [Acidimicrobiales bacterium]
MDANLAAATAPAAACSGRAYNIAGGKEQTLLDLLAALNDILGVSITPDHVAARPGDVRHSSADLTAAAHDLGYRPSTDFVDSLRRTVESFT